MTRLHTLRALVLALPLVLSGAAAALANPYAENLTVRLLPGWRAADGRHIAGLELTLAEGWKTYWRTPGEGGVPPQFDWSGSRNLRGLHVVWPRPEVFDLNGLRSIGYSKRVVLPLLITPSETGSAVELSGVIALGICREVCVPLDLSLSGALPQGGKRDPRIAAALAERPYSAREGKVRKVVCRAAPGRLGVALDLDIAMPSAGGKETVVVESATPGVWSSDARSTRKGGRIMANSELFQGSGGVFALDRSGLTITVLGEDYAVEIKGCSGS